ncbi:MAG: hypothetical protein ACREE5_12010, partial [Acetobacteraceae bacterium]
MSLFDRARETCGDSTSGHRALWRALAHFGGRFLRLGFLPLGFLPLGFLLPAAALLGLLAPVTAAAAGGLTVEGGILPGQLCRAAIVSAEQSFAIPTGLLGAIGQVESGRRDPLTGAYLPWPW